MDQPAWKYHNTTSYERSKMGGYFLDWENQPDLFKSYATRELLEMPKGIPLPKEDLFTLYDRPFMKDKPKTVKDLADLSRILLLAYTLTSQARHSNGTFYYRSAASAGALYPTEIYVSLFGQKVSGARRLYSKFVEEGVSKGKRPELVGGGLIRSLGGWASAKALRGTKDRIKGDECILGDGDFAQEV